MVGHIFSSLLIFETNNAVKMNMPKHNLAHYIDLLETIFGKFLGNRLSSFAILTWTDKQTDSPVCLNPNNLNTCTFSQRKLLNVKITDENCKKV